MQENSKEWHQEFFLFYVFHGLAQSLYRCYNIVTVIKQTAVSFCDSRNADSNECRFVKNHKMNRENTSKQGRHDL